MRGPTLTDPTSILSALDELLDRGRGVRATIRPAAGAPPPGTRTAGVPVDDWSSQRSIVYDQAMANRWKADCLRVLREAFGAEGAPYREFGAAVERAGVLWRAIDPALDLLTRLRVATAEGGPRRSASRREDAGVPTESAPSGGGERSGPPPATDEESRA